jgi:hypothetical protein
VIRCALMVVGGIVGVIGAAADSPTAMLGGILAGLVGYGMDLRVQGARTARAIERQRARAHADPVERRA